MMLPLAIQVIAETLSDLIRSRFRTSDARFIVPLGIAYWLSNAAILQLIRVKFRLADALGAIGNNTFADPRRVLAGATTGVLMVLLVALFQVSEKGIPEGLTRKAALFPVLFQGLFGIGALPIVAASSGSWAYAVVAAVITCANTLWVSFALRRLRMEG